jgi:lysophospholipase L1-like esterase
MAALGDSITRATSTCSTLSGCLSNSWSTGTSSTVNSHYSRLRAAGAPATLVASNLAANGATSGALNAQASSAVTQAAQYVTIEIGANDACTSTVSAMTPTATFKSNVQSALATLSSAGAGSPEIFVASIPNLLRMYELNKSNLSARLIWGALRICQSMLANPTSTNTADVQRRAAVQQRVNEYNAALAEACSAVMKCRFDGLAIANYSFSRTDISTRDYFHPSVTGQARFAALTWPKTQWATP